jgi:hypothetical protein
MHLQNKNEKKESYHKMLTESKLFLEPWVPLSNNSCFMIELLNPNIHNLIAEVFAWL